MPICHFCNVADKCRLSKSNPTDHECEIEKQKMDEENDIYNERIVEDGVVSSTENEFIFNEEDDDIVTDWDPTELEEDEIDKNDPWYDETDFEEDEEDEE